MSASYVGEIRLVGFNFAPAGWALCNGQLLAISQYEPLYSLIGTLYGGDGTSTFGLPNLQGRVPVSQGNNYPMGQMAGAYQVTLTGPQLPSHNHLINCQNGSSGASGSPVNNYFGLGSKIIYAPPGTLATMGSIVGQTGGSQAHENMQPYLTVNYIISLFGNFPTQG